MTLSILAPFKKIPWLRSGYQSHLRFDLLTTRGVISAAGEIGIRVLRPEAVIVRCEGLMSGEVGDEVLALHVDKGVCYRFNKTASRIWSLIGEPRELREVINQLASEFRIDRVLCEREVLELLEDLQSDGLIRIQK